MPPGCPGRARSRRRTPRGSRCRGSSCGLGLRPGLPGRLAGAPELLEVVLVAQRIHRLPEAEVLPGVELAVRGEALERRGFPAGRVALDVVDHARLEDEEA